MYTNKKAYFKYLAGILAMALIIALWTITFFIIKAEIDQKEREGYKNIAVLDARQTTRAVLQEEIRPGYFVYDLVIEAHEKGDFNMLVEELRPVLKRVDDLERENWLIRMDGQRIPGLPGISNLVIETPPVQIPKEDGTKILFLVKALDPRDEDIPRTVYRLEER